MMALMIGGITGGIVYEQLSIDASRNAYASRTQARRDYFNQEKKDYNTYSIISFIAAGAVYAWNVADAIMVKQENLYVEIDEAGRLAIRVRL
jgi:nucleoside diphosphate kinase